MGRHRLPILCKTGDLKTLKKGRNLRVNKKTQTVAFANLVGSVIFLVIGVWAWFQMANLQEVKDTYAQPSAFPMAMIVGMLVFCVILLIQSVYYLVSMKDGSPGSEKAESINLLKDRGVQGALIVIALCVAFVLLFKPLGYVLTGALVAFVIMVLIGKRNWLQMVLVSLLIPLAMWTIFYKLLSVNIPLGPLTFLRSLMDMI